MRADGSRSPFPVVQVKGVDSACAARPERSALWSLEGKLPTAETMSIDFSSKGGPKGVLGKWDTTGGKGGILFPDGNKWLKVAGGTPDRRPLLPTLVSQD